MNNNYIFTNNIPKRDIKVSDKIIKVLAIETSCDETAVSIVDSNKNILSNIINSQINIHKEFGGVVPEIAARLHVDIIDELIIKALSEANISPNDIDAFAATAGPGLIGGVIVGATAAKTLSYIYNKPFIAINHLEAHALTVRLTNNIEFPYLLLLLSGGHCQILFVKNYDKYIKIGETIDDALGEAFDKVAQMLNLGYPGGPAIEKLAINGDQTRFNFPLPLTREEKHKYNFSFSGLKTAVRREIEKLAGNIESADKVLSIKDKSDISASFQNCVTKILINRLNNLTNYFFKENNIELKDIVIAGGVAANRYIFEKIKNWGEENNINVVTPPIKLCTDNAAMIAWNAIEKFQNDNFSELDFKSKARWALSDN